MPKWVWVRDESTGHQYDVEASTLPRPGLAEVEGVAPVEGPGAQPRQAKPYVDKAGKPAEPKRTETQQQQETPADKPADTSNRSKR